MFGFGHIFEILVVLFVGLLVFGPKRIIEMGSSFGKMFREFRDATREMSWSNLISDQPDSPRQSASSRASSAAQSASASGDETKAAATAAPIIVESTLAHPGEPPQG